jgi:dCMP deaminase
MIGATLYLTGTETATGEYIAGTTPCTMCRRFIINAGIAKVICRLKKDVFSVTHVRDWVFNDDSLPAIL